MSLLAALRDGGKVHSYEQAFGARDVTTAEMRSAIREWFALYYAVPTPKEDPCQRIPNAIVNKLTKAVFGEYTATAAVQSEYLTSILCGLRQVQRAVVQKALVGGIAYLKPLLKADGSVRFSVVSRNNLVVFARGDGPAAVTSIGTAEKTEISRRFYTLLERRTVDENGYLTLENKLYTSYERETLGVEVPLTTLEQYARLEPIYTYQQPLHSLGLIPVCTPIENCVDGSMEPVSVYAQAVGLIHNINHNEFLLDEEFERGQSRIIASTDMMERDENGRRRLVDNVFMGLDDDPSAVGITIFSPELREQSFRQRKTEYLRNAESLIGLKRGLLSEVEAAERTAKEITSSEGDYNLTIIDFQQMWENAVREAVRVCVELGRLYHVYSGPDIDPEKDVVIDFGNGVLYDRDKTWAEYQAMVAAGLMKPEIALGWYFSEPVETEADLRRIRTKYMPTGENMLSHAGDEDDE